MPQSVCCRITRCPLGGWPWPSRPSRAHWRSVAGVIRPPMLRITTLSPSSRPSTSLGSTRESTQPSTCRVSLVGKGRPANAPVAANAALRPTSSLEEMTTSSEPTHRRTFQSAPELAKGQLVCATRVCPPPRFSRAQRRAKARFISTTGQVMLLTRRICCIPRGRGPGISLGLRLREHLVRQLLDPDVADAVLEGSRVQVDPELAPVGEQI